MRMMGVVMTAVMAAKVTTETATMATLEVVMTAKVTTETATVATLEVVMTAILAETATAGTMEAVTVTAEETLTTGIPKATNKYRWLI
jgi:hypothetical protein